jgi:hypothetical protein
MNDRLRDSDQTEIPVLIGLPITKDDVRKLCHEGDRSMIHELEAAGIVGFHETVGISESV